VRRDRLQGEGAPRPPIEGDWPYLGIDTIYVQMSQNGRVMSVAVVVTPARGSRQDVGPCEAEALWTASLRKLARERPARRQSGFLRRGRGHQGQRCQGGQRRLAALPTCPSCATRWRTPATGGGAWSPPSSPPAFAQDDAAAASDQWLVTSPGVAYIWSRMHGRFLSSTRGIGSKTQRAAKPVGSAALLLQSGIVTR
jgi:hypothetical protein